MFERTCGFESRPRHHVENQVSLDAGGNLKCACRALVAQRIERSPAKAEVVGSNPAKRAISFCWGPRNKNPPKNITAGTFWSRGCNHGGALTLNDTKQTPAFQRENARRS